MKMTRSSAALLVLAIVASCFGLDGREENGDLIKVGASTYLFPAGSVINIPQSSEETGYIRFTTNELNDRPTKDSLTFEYNPRFNSSDRLFYFERHGLTSPSEDISVRWVLGGSKKGMLTLRRLPWGKVICNKTSVVHGFFMSCGFSIVEAGSLWQVTFHNDKLNPRNNLIVEARLALRDLRRNGKAVAQM